MTTTYKYLFLTLLLLSLNQGIVFSQDNYAIKKLFFNTEKYGEIGGYFFDTLLIFSSNGSSGGILNFSYNLFKTIQNADMTWNEPELFHIDLTTNQHNAPIYLNKAKDKIYITSANVIIEDLNNLKGDSIESGIYIRDFKNGRWSYTATGFVNNKPGYIVAQACLNKSEDELYFTANFSDSKGGTDIYKSYLINGVWSKPQNIGSEINTTGNEMYPFMHDNRLYFSSNSHNSKGELDIFYSDKINGKWTKPVPVGNPINSTYNDFAFFIDKKSERGFFTSDRDGSFDIFSIISNYQEFTDCKEATTSNKCVTLFETRTSSLDTNIFQFEWELGDGNIRYGEKIDYCYKNYGTYNITLNVYDKLTDKKITNVANSNVDISLDEGIYFDMPEQSKVNKKVMFNNVDININGIENYNLFWDFGDGFKSTNKNEEHIYKNSGEYIVKLGLVSNQGVLKELIKYCVYKKINIIK